MAAGRCSEAYRSVTAETVQLHGGIGFTWEHDAHLYFRRARADAVLLGGAAHHRERLAVLLGWWRAGRRAASGSGGRGSWDQGTSLSTRGSGGRPSTRSAMMLRWIWSVPPASR